MGKFFSCTPFVALLLRFSYVALAVLVLLLSLNLVLFDSSFYASHASQYEIHQDTIDNMLSFFIGADLYISEYSSREIVHLYDVRSLVFVELMLFIIVGCLLLPLLSLGTRPMFKKTFLRGGVASFIVAGLLAVGLSAFSFAFRIFHEIFFFNDYWLLPPDSLLIQMFPQSFFVAATVRILLYTLIFSFFLFVLGLLIPGENHGKATYHYHL